MWQYIVHVCVYACVHICSKKKQKDVKQKKTKKALKKKTEEVRYYAISFILGWVVSGIYSFVYGN